MTDSLKGKYGVFEGRLVMGSIFDMRTTTHENKPEPNENKHHWFMGFAVPKGPQWDAVWATMYNTALGDSRCNVQDQAGFGWKIEDCDAPSNPVNLGKPSYPAGHWIIKFSRYKQMGACPLVDGNFNPIIDKNAVKRGDYFMIDASCEFNGCATIGTNAGMYQNINGLMFSRAGEEIIGEGGFNAATAFAGVQGGQVQQAPQGMAPQTPAQAPQHMAPQAPQAPVQQAPQAPVQQAPQAPVTPATDLVQPGQAPQAPQLPTPAPQVQAEPSYIVDGNTYTKSMLVGFGYTEAHFAAMQPV